jgi:glycosyltransferase involved in cell wall biosynthesis
MKFSVLMSIYHKEKVEYFDRAMKSIWDDQVLKPDQIVLVQDGKLTQDLYDIIDAWKSSLLDILTIVTLKDNVGFAKALNEGLKYCKYDLVARMDTDDISLPERFIKQIKFLRDNGKIAVCGTFIKEFNGKIAVCGTFIKEFNGVVSKNIELPTKQEDIVKFAKLRSPICHPSSVFRKKEILKVGGYPELRLGQDYALWSVLLSKGYNLANIPEVLLKLRTNSDFFRRRGWESFKYEVAVVKIQYQENFIGALEAYKAISLRLLLRLSPVLLKKLAYKLLRN